MLPILKDEPVGLKLEALVPFKYWLELKVKPVIDTVEGVWYSTWLQVYNLEKKLNATSTEVMRILNDDIQPIIFQDLRPGKMSRLICVLKPSDDFLSSPEFKTISESTLYRSI
jgi:hypothetical protein